MKSVLPKVSVVIPNYNHAPYLKQRIESVLGQTFQDFEIILMDDCSTDESVEILKRYEQHPKVNKLILNEQNSGSAFRQWKKGIEHARGTYIWIAESDDMADTHFLEKLFPLIDNDHSISLAYTQSLDIDTNDNILANRVYWTNNFSPNIWHNNFIMDGKEFIERYLASKNVIPNASAVVFRRDKFLDNYDRTSTSMKMLGDWLLWISILKGSKVAFLATPLNKFRKHASTTRVHDTHQKKLARIIEEVYIIDKVSEVLPLNKYVVQRLLEKHFMKWFAQFPYYSSLFQKDFYTICKYHNISPQTLLYKKLILSVKNRLQGIIKKINGLLHAVNTSQ